MKKVIAIIAATFAITGCAIQPASTTPKSLAKVGSCPAGQVLITSGFGSCKVPGTIKSYAGAQEICGCSGSLN